jgi:hypothetical protein
MPPVPISRSILNRPAITWGTSISDLPSGKGRQELLTDCFVKVLGKGTGASLAHFFLLIYLNPG